MLLKGFKDLCGVGVRLDFRHDPFDDAVFVDFYLYGCVDIIHLDIRIFNINLELRKLGKNL